MTSLPLRKKRTQAPLTATDSRQGPLPLGRRAIVAGEPIEFHNWLCCGPRQEESIHEIQRYITLEDEPLFRFGEVSR